MIECTLHGSTALIAFANPPVNALSFPLRRDLVDALDRAMAAPAVRAIVLFGRNDTFSGGADIREFSTPDGMRAPIVRHVIAAIESSDKPVIAAIAGSCLGGGLEVALGCHYRIFARTATLGLPEVKLGILPGAGGTQRLPRLLGIETALDMIVSGASVPVMVLAKTPLVDELVEGDLLEGALAFAAKVIEAGKPAPRVRDKQIKEPRVDALCESAREAARATVHCNVAPLKCIDAVHAAATMTFEAGYELEARSLDELVATPESAALRHAFFAERAASRLPSMALDGTGRIKSAAVAGAGTTGTGIAINFLDAGIPVHLLDAEHAALGNGVSRIRSLYASQVKKGALQPEALAERMALLAPTTEYVNIAHCDIVIEAVPEDLGAKESVFRTLDGVMKPGAILATNTSTLNLDRIAGVTGRPQDVVGMHFFTPANVMPLLEIVRCASTAAEVLWTTMKLARTLRKTAVVSGVCEGLIGNRMIEQSLRQALLILEDGASPSLIDAAAEQFGFAAGPFRASDPAGNDVAWKALVDRLIASRRVTLGIVSRSIDDDEIVDRLVLALVNEGARIIEEGIAERASDIDVVCLTAYGFPRWRGGPMFYAEQRGLREIVGRMRALGAKSRGDSGFWEPAPLLARLAQRGGSFNTTEKNH